MSTTTTASTATNTNSNNHNNGNHTSSSASDIKPLETCNLTWKIESKTIDSNGIKLRILNDMSFYALKGQLTGIMGPSGSGKTTLMQVLGGRQLQGVVGQVYMNREPFNGSMKRLIAYVLQEDVFFPSNSWTVDDQLLFHATLRLPSSIPMHEKVNNIENILQSLHLKHVRNTCIFKLSGGERKRTSLAVELLVQPPIILIDEGLSGLDSSSAIALMKVLRKLCNEKQKTILISIHQASQYIFYQCDKLLIIANGSVIYAGLTKQFMNYLNSIGYSPTIYYSATQTTSNGYSLNEDHINPADYVMELINSYDDSAGNKARCDDLVEKWKQGELQSIINNDIKDIVSEEGKRQIVSPFTKGVAPKQQEFKDANGMEEGTIIDTEEAEDGEREQIKLYVQINRKKEYPSTYGTQIRCIFLRSLKSTVSKAFNCINIVQTLLISFIAGIIWFQRKFNDDYITDIIAFCFFSNSYWLFLSLFSGMLVFIPERVILQREREAGAYRLSAYFIGKTLAELVRLVHPIVFIIIAYPMALYPFSFIGFFMFMFLLILTYITGESIGIFIGSCVIDHDKAISLATITALLFMVSMLITTADTYNHTYISYHTQICIQNNAGIRRILCQKLSRFYIISAVHIAI